jgi:hypothetical protein
MMADNSEHVISYWVIFQAFHSPTLAGFAIRRLGTRAACLLYQEA